jgi:hypothetical protein
MSHFRFLLMLPVAGGVLLLLGSLGLVHPLGASRAERADSLPAAPPSQTVLPTDTPPDAEATQVFERALAAHDPAKVTWAEMNLWQQVNVQGLIFEAQGHYLSAPGQRWRLDLQTRRGNTDGTLQVVSDGTTLWQVLRVGTGNWVSYSRVNLPDVLAFLDSPETAPQVGDEFFLNQARGGILTLLPRLRYRMNWVRKETVRRNGRVLLKLAGTWTPAEAVALSRSGTTWPNGLPRQCRLYLDPDTLWPYRLEWWGPQPARRDDSLLVQLEFRDPVLNRAPPAEQVARAFQPDVNPIQVPDATALVLGQLEARARSLARAPAISRGQAATDPP